MTEGMHLLRLTNICYYGYNKVFMHLKEVTDDWLTTGLCSFITLFIWLYPLSVCVSVCLCVCLLISQSFFNRFSSVIHGWTRLRPGQGPIIINWWIIQCVSKKKTPLKSILYCFFVNSYTTTTFYISIAFHNLNHVSKFEGNRLKTRVLVAILAKATLIVKSQSER